MYVQNELPETSSGQTALVGFKRKKHLQKFCYSAWRPKKSYGFRLLFVAILGFCKGFVPLDRVEAHHQ